MRENIIIVWKDRRCATAAWSDLPAVISAGSGGGPAGCRRTRTLYELGQEYAQTAAVLKDRIRQVEDLREREADDSQCRLLDYRLRVLRAMWRETRALAVHLEHYYERGVSRDENYIL